MLTVYVEGEEVPEEEWEPECPNVRPEHAALDHEGTVHVETEHVGVVVACVGVVQMCYQDMGEQA